MGNDNSIVKSIRISGEQFEQANDIFKREGFSFSEAVKIFLEATIREGRVPRSLSTRAMENKLDDAKMRDDYVSDILSSVLPQKSESSSNEKRLVAAIFGHEHASDMSNAELREWASKWGLPDSLSVATLADLYECDLFTEDPWHGEYDYECMPATNAGSKQLDEHLSNAMTLMKFRDNLNNNLEQMKHKMHVAATKTLMELDNIQ